MRLLIFLIGTLTLSKFTDINPYENMRETTLIVGR